MTKHYGHHNHYKKLHIPDHWEHYWSKYPNGYTLLEALISWTSQVNDMIVSYNHMSDDMVALDRNFRALEKELRASWEGYKDHTEKTYSDFREEVFTIINNWLSTIETTIQDTVVSSLSGWLSDGTLADIINNDVFDMKANQTDLDNVSALLKQIAVSVHDFGAVGDGVTDDSEAFETALNYVADNNGTLTSDPNKTYIIDNVYIANKSNFTLDLKGTLKRADNLPYAESKFNYGTGVHRSSKTLYFDNCENIFFKEIHLDGNHINNGCVVGSATYDTELGQQFRTSLEFNNCKDIYIDRVFVKNASGDGMLFRGSETNRITINEYVYTSLDENGNSIDVGRNSLSIIDGKNYTINSLKQFGGGHWTMPGGLDIEPESWMSVENVDIKYLYIESSGYNPLGIFTGEGKDKIKNVNIDRAVLKVVGRTGKDYGRGALLSGATGVSINYIKIMGILKLNGTYGLHIGGNGDGVDNLYIGKAEVFDCDYGAVIRGATNFDINLSVFDAYSIGAFIANDVINGDLLFDGNIFNDSTVGTSYVLNLNSGLIKNVKISGNLNADRVGYNKPNFLIYVNDACTIENVKLDNLDFSGWWKAGTKTYLISGGKSNLLKKANCEGVNSTTDIKVDCYIYFRKGDVIKNDNITQLTDSAGKKYYIKDWTVVAENSGTRKVVGTTIVANKIYHDDVVL